MQSFSGVVFVGLLLLSPLARSAIRADPDLKFDTGVKQPYFVKAHPVVRFDEAHQNYHTAVGRYQPLARLLKSDGYRIERGRTAFSREALAKLAVLLISNAQSKVPGESAFSAEECAVVHEWVQRGGALFLIADHAPFGSAAASLAREFSVEMGDAYVFDVNSSLPDEPSNLVFSHGNEGLGNHFIITGRGPFESVQRIVAFLGQSLSVPSGATALLILGPAAYESATNKDLEVAVDAAQAKPRDQARLLAHAKSVAGRAQAVALQTGQGRVVVAGEAAMYSAQIATGPDIDTLRFGMNAAGNDDKQFVLNVLHWLSGADSR